MKMKSFLLFIISFFSLNFVKAQWVNCNLPGWTTYGCVNSWATDDTNIFAGDIAHGVYSSSDDGFTWSAINNDLASHNVNALIIDGPYIFAGGSSGVFMSSNNGTNWSYKSTGLTNHPISSFALKDSLIFVATMGGGIYISNNHGDFWSPVNQGLTNSSIKTLLVSGNVIWAGSIGGGIFLSNDNGQNWSPANNGLTNLSVISLAMIDSTIFAGTNGNGVFISNNSGGLWSPVNNGINSFQQEVYSMAAYGSHLFSVVGYDLYQSENKGTDWTLINGLIHDVTSVTTTNNKIFVGTDSYGAFERSLDEVITFTKEKQDNSDYLLFPNPNNGRFFINNNNKVHSIEIYNSVGIKVYSSSLNESKIEFDLSNQPKGIYILKIQDERGISIKKAILE